MSTQAPIPTGGIQHLVLDNKGDRSYDRLSKDCGGKPSGPALQKMAKGALKAFPDVESIRGLSRGLNVPVREVLHACARSVGLPIATDDDETLHIVGGKKLPKEAQDAILTMARELSKAYEGPWGGEKPDYDLAAHVEDPKIDHDDIEHTT